VFLGINVLCPIALPEKLGHYEPPVRSFGLKNNNRGCGWSVGWGSGVGVAGLIL